MPASSKAVVAVLTIAVPISAAAQSPRSANPERPTFATHAYTVAPGYIELEQGLAARGVASLGEETGWDVNLKFGISHHAQGAFFGALYDRTPGGTGIGDVGAALKLRTELSPQASGAIVTTVTAPTGSAARGLGAGRALGGLIGVLSVDLPAGLHVDANAGPQGIGGGAPVWFLSVGGARALGRAGVTVEVFHFTSGGSGSRLSGVLGAMTLRAAEWLVLDAGGVVRTTSGTPDQVFVGCTTNLGHLF